MLRKTFLKLLPGFLGGLAIIPRVKPTGLSHFWTTPAGLGRATTFKAEEPTVLTVEILEDVYEVLKASHQPPYFVIRRDRCHYAPTET